MYKTQVFINRRGDHQRTRLSHSLEVHQVARSVGSALGLNEPLCEALALAHDIGHPPFGHRGEDALNELMGEHGGFRHNAQVLRVVDLLERRSPDYRGLNLTREVRESLLKHEKGADWPADLEPRPLHPWLEAQVVDLADSTAYNMHDIEDGIAAGMFTEEDIREHVALWSEAHEVVEERHPGFLKKTEDVNLRVKRVSNQLIKACINDLIETSGARIVAAGITRPQEARERRESLVAHGASVARGVAELSSFLWQRVYRHELLVEFSLYAREVLGALFCSYCDAPDAMSPWYRAWADEVGLERAVCDFLAGMTDRFAEQEFERLGGR
jgi:dGTPase